MNPTKVNRMGMELDLWINQSCSAEIGVGDDWATVYMIESTEKRKGHAEELLIEMRKYYEGHNKRFASSVALNKPMQNLLKKLNITEYK